jgi:hypothetical protein
MIDPPESPIPPHQAPGSIGQPGLSVNSPSHLAPFVDELATALTADAALNVALPDTSPDNAGSTGQKGDIDDGLSMSIE